VYAASPTLSKLFPRRWRPSAAVPPAQQERHGEEGLQREPRGAQRDRAGEELEVGREQEPGTERDEPGQERQDVQHGASAPPAAAAPLIFLILISLISAGLWHTGQESAHRDPQDSATIACFASG
jgi:hypothetical protein